MFLSFPAVVQEQRVKMRNEMRKWSSLKNKPSEDLLYDYFSSQAFGCSKSGNTWRPQATKSTVLYNEPEKIRQEQTTAHHWVETLPDLQGDLSTYLFPEGEQIASEFANKQLDRPIGTHSLAPRICSIGHMSDRNLKMALDGDSQMVL